MADLLEGISSTQVLKTLSKSQLEQLAAEIREEIISTVANNGGHLSSSLGVVELSIALHTVFDSPADKIIWDVGHQCYAHKLLTGRYKHFKTMRKLNGISGFPKRSESQHDPFNTGHSSTSLSAALGMAVGRDYFYENGHVIAVIGDGALTGGMALEALNNIGFLQKRLIIILNDNENSISKSVGALSTYLGRIRSTQIVRKFKSDARNFVRKNRGFGGYFVHLYQHLKRGARQALLPSKEGVIFEELGISYLGPIDGHDFAQLLATLKGARNFEKPVMIHVKSKKGKGYDYAEQDAAKFHGISSFDKDKGKTYPISGAKTYDDVFGETIVKLAEKDSSIVAITAAMTQGNGLSHFSQKYPDRFFDVGIAEQHAVTFAAGLAASGVKPVVAIYSTFLQRAYDQIVHDVCLQELPVVFAVNRAGLVGEDGATHQGVFDCSYLRHIPNMVLMQPKDQNEFKDMLHAAVNLGKPAAVRFPRGQGVEVEITPDFQKIKQGKMEIILEGSDVTIISAGHLVYSALEAAKLLKKNSAISATVINIRFIKPLDIQGLMKASMASRKVLVVEEHVTKGGLGSAILEAFSSADYDAKVSLLGIPDIFVEHGTQSELRELLGITPRDIAKAAKALVTDSEVSLFNGEHSLVRA